MKPILIAMVLMICGCGSGPDEPMPLDEFCEAWATAWCDAEVSCSGVAMSCDRASKITRCYSRWACLVDVGFARSCLDEIEAWDCIYWPESCAEAC